ncbi:hypothetical protein AW40_13775 [Kosakonia radicincitans UMEnt01/12]|uniref:hypothetical protein n=1 Tax=Kosakonia radicincitans TaxID=283686 RepID=UPI000460B254|nr:hypothetical protein [Kosakonia radicincitans]KDE35919.1 hypothetical protein AW40_13775 [Kosakonia radicincitans UMEnt01/12]
MFSLCPIHSVARDVTVSKTISEALEKNLPVKDVVELIIVHPDENMRRQYIIIDSALLTGMGINHTEDGFILYDRDRVNKKMNDRMIIRKISNHLAVVCPVCLFEKLGLKITE